MNQLTRYFTHTVLTNGSQVPGVQSVTLGKTFDMTTIIAKGRPAVSTNFYKVPNFTLSFSRFMADNVAPWNAGFDLSTIAYVKPPSLYDITIGIVGGGSLLCKEFYLKSLGYSFSAEGNFTEQIAFEGATVTTADPISESAVGDAGLNLTGNVKRRQHYTLGGEPAEVQSLLSGGHALLSVETSMNLNYGHIPTWGRLYASKNKYISYPVDISCTYEILDRGYAQGNTNYYDVDNNPLSPNYIIDDTVYNRQITVGGYPTIDLGPHNFLVNVDRSGGEAGQGKYSTYKYTYKNTENYFKLS